ncbi:hypothetical protein ACFPM3_16940 [Streptomyces coeruleoprunus]|uniref:Uncharacterized protein n=1 Tax=Streptomyces coeruleoprunus TaxID=285563 RepID=A0ABV9XGG4_9ACTN
MHTELRETATELATLLWRQHTVYRERGGGVVIRGEHVERWISLAPSGGRDEVLIRAGRILDGGTTAPARSEAVVSITAGTTELAAICRRLLAETASAGLSDGGPGAHSGTASAPRRPGRTRQPRKPKAGRTRRVRQGRDRHTSLTSWVVLACVAAAIGVYVYNVALAHG